MMYMILFQIFKHFVHAFIP